MIQDTNVRKVTEDAPKMRSCILLAQPRPISSLPMPMPTPMPMPVRRPFSMTQNKTSRLSLTKKDNKLTNSSILAPCWKVDTLECLPKIHVLERTHVSISNASVQEITMRITTCFENESIKASFNKRMAVAEAETIDHIHFVVRLFATDCASNIIVEVQRVLGCSYGFNQIARTVLNAAKCIKRSHPPNRRSALQIVNTIPAMAIDQRKKEESITESLEISLNMSRSTRFDTNQLALDILLQLTSNSNSLCDRCFAASEILSGPFLKKLLLATKNTTTPLTVERQYSTKMHRDALTVLANCLDATETSKKLTRSDILCTDELISSLIEELKQSSINPHEAYQATRCLGSLLRSYVQLKKLASIHDIIDDTICAFNEGTASHAMLKKESQKLRISVANN